MKIKKSLLGLGAIVATGLSLVVSLPFVLSSCSSTNSDSNENPITFSGVEKPVVPHKEVSITANVANPENYSFAWAYSNDGSNWNNIEGSKKQTLVIPADKVNHELNKYQFK